jgi:2-polyprenyl-3-methyl-5-hydroxy-6-metoxy-1,4-benzoquinol methylase
MNSKSLSERTIYGLHDALIYKLPGLSADISILDIGCGTGAWLDRLANQGFRNLHGIDLDIKQFATSQATCSQANLDYDDFDLDNQKFDLITAIEVIEHLENPGRLLYHISSHLSDGGYFLMTTPNIHSVSCRLRFFLTGKLASFDEKGDQTHIYPVLLDALFRVLPRYSLEIVEQWGYPAKSSVIYTGTTQVLSTLSKLFVPDRVPGDTLCLLIRRGS